MADIFEEVEEGLRQERYGKLLRKYGPIGAAAVAAVILGVAGREAWSALRAQAAVRSSAAYDAAQTALDAGDLDAAAAQFSALAESGSGAYDALAKMQEAAVAVVKGSKADAARLYEEAAGLTRDPLLSGIARLKAAYLSADTLDLPALEAKLAPLRERGSPFEPLASELVGAAALRAGDYKKAREAYTVLTASLDAPGGVARRAEEALAVIDAAEAAASPTDEEG
jgi:hypothetical protein